MGFSVYEKCTSWCTNVILFPKSFEESAMQIDCTECGNKAFIHSRRRLDIKMSQLYCTCKNPQCGHTFVMDLSFSHTLSPSGQQTRDMMINLLRALPDAERRQLLMSV